MKIISFGGINHGPGIPVDEFKNTLKNVSCDIDFITDINRAWYYRGIDEAINNHYRLKMYLDSLIEGYDDVTFVGNSMGGFAAILFGSLLEVDKVIAFNPQTFLGKKLRKEHRDNRWNKYVSELQAEFPDHCLDLLEKMKFGNATKYEIHFQSNHVLNTIHAERLLGLPNFDFFKYTGLGKRKNLVKYLRDNNLLISILIGGRKCR